MSMFSMMLSFAPWLVLKIVCVLPFADPLTMLKAALVIAFAVSLCQSLRSKVRGFIFWGTIFFFSFSFVTVVLMSNMWVIGHLGMLSQLNMNVMAWGSMLFKRPFTIDYAKQCVPQQYWTHPRFLRKNYIITGVWGVYFLLGLALTEIRVYEPHVSHVLIEILDNASMIGAMLFTCHMSKQPKSAQLPPEGDAAA